MLYEKEFEIFAKEYLDLRDKIKELENKKRKMTKQFKDWFKMNNIVEYNLNINDELYKASIIDFPRKSTDYVYLEEILTAEQYDTAIKITESSKFDIRPVKNAKFIKPPTAPNEG